MSHIPDDTASSPSSTLPSTTSVTKLMTALIVGGITAILDTTVVTLGLHSLTQQLHSPVSTIQWVSTGYLLALAISIPFVSWLQEQLGSKRLWLFALGLFLVGSTLSACAWNAESLITFRVIQGVGGGIMFPLMQTIAMQHVDREKMTKTMAIVGLPAALGPILGPVLGGLVLHWLDWRWLFLINLPVGIVGFILAVLWLKDEPSTQQVQGHRLDVIGAILLVPALAGLLYGLSNTYAEGGFGRADVLLPGITGIVLLAAFVWWAKRRRDTALVDVQLLAERSVRVSSIALTLLGATLFAGNFLLPLYFQTLRGYSALDAALLLIPQGVGALLARAVVGQLVERFGARTVSICGFLAMAAATIPFAVADAHTNLWYLGVMLFVRGLGNGIVLIPIMTTAYLDIRRDQMPQASAITRIVQQLGGAFGTALVAVVLTSVGTQTHLAAGFNAAFWWTVGFTLVAAITALLLPSRQPAAQAPANAPQAQTDGATRA